MHATNRPGKFGRMNMNGALLLNPLVLTLFQSLQTASEDLKTAISISMLLRCENAGDSG